MGRELHYVIHATLFDESFEKFCKALAKELAETTTSWAYIYCGRECFYFKHLWGEGEEDDNIPWELKRIEAEGRTWLPFIFILSKNLAPDCNVFRKVFDYSFDGDPLVICNDDQGVIYPDLMNKPDYKIDKIYENSKEKE